MIVCYILRNSVSVLRNSDAGAAVLKKSTLTDAELFYIELNYNLTTHLHQQTQTLPYQHMKC